MITESFDDSSEAIISPESFFGEKKDICKIAIATFSRKIYPSVLEKYPHEQIAEIRAANRCRPIYLLTVDNQWNIVFYLSEIGAALAATDIIEINHLTGAEHFIMFGSAGSLNHKITDGKYVIPTAAYRDEGMSYHYAPPSDYISIKNSSFTANCFEKWQIPFVQGKIWTTDALYRETRNLFQKRQAEGCIAVEMELAGVQAVCDFHKIELYHFLITGDILDDENYSSTGLSEANHNIQKFDIALKMAGAISEKFLLIDYQERENL